MLEKDTSSSTVMGTFNSNSAEQLNTCWSFVYGFIFGQYFIYHGLSTFMFLDIFKLYTIYYCVFPRNMQKALLIMKHITTLAIENSANSTPTLPETITKSVIMSSISEGTLRFVFYLRLYFVLIFSKYTQNSYLILDKFIS